jgi:serine/threonine protein kinase/TolA-binding protein
MRCLLQLGLRGFENPEAPAASPDSERNQPSAGTTAEKPGDIIDRFRLIRPVGEGGFGVVFEAEQETPVRRKVALKVIKLGMDTRQVVARFEAERQALALMEHPNIARVLDGGMTPAGRPYFVMEFVNGIKITDYCDQHQLTLRQRLDLFVQVCQAIQHAHQKGIIHRDIKPSNILVADQDGVPVPKVIDFGIAKATLDSASGERPYETTLQFFAGTPAYMSPEQAGMGGLDVDARSDIYSLGMLLYELLTARPAFCWDELSHAALNEILRVIRESEPARPSTQLTSLAPQELTVIARCRRAEPDRLPTLLRGDLDWVVMKAIEKDRNRRYETANGLAMDIQRHLDHQPVLARPPSRLYLLQKMVRRNRLACAAAAAVTIALVAGLGVSSWMYARETQARVLAEAAEKKAASEAEKSVQTAKFLKEMLTSVGPSVALGRDTALLREILDKTSTRVGKELQTQPDLEAEMRGTLGSVYLALGDYDKAANMSLTALALRKKLYGENDSRVADSLNDLGNVLYRQTKLKDAEATHRAALALRRKLFGNHDPRVAASLNNLANVLWGQGKLTDAEAMLREALALRRELLGDVSAETVETMDNLAGVLSLEDKLAEAEKMQREALALNNKLLGNEHPDVAYSMNNLADTLSAEGKLTEAEAMNRETLAMRRKLLGEDHPDVAFSLFALAGVLVKEGKLDEGEADHRLALATRRKLLGTNHLDVAGSLNNLAALLIDEHKLDEAEVMQREALAIQRKKLSADHPDIAGSLLNLAAILQAQTKLPEAESLLREALAIQKKLLGNESLDVAQSLGSLAQILQGQGKLTEAESLARESLAMRRKLLGGEHSDVAFTLAALADILNDEHKLAEAEPLQREELAMRRSLLAKESPHQPATVNSLADAFTRSIPTLLAEEKFSDAEQSGRDFLAFAEKEMPQAWQTSCARSLLGASLLEQKKFAEAEPLLLQAVEDLERQKNSIPDQAIVAGAVERLVQLYQLTNRPELAAEWSKKLPPAK